MVARSGQSGRNMGNTCQDRIEKFKKYLILILSIGKD
jgi:hypothetical protein